MNETFNHYFRLRKISNVHKRRNIKSPLKLQSVREECGEICDSVKGVRCALFQPDVKPRIDKRKEGDSSLELVH